MKSFESGVTYLRKEALKYGLIRESDNDDKLIERLARIVRGQDPFDGDAELASEAEIVREAHAEELIKKIDEGASEDESGSDKESE